VLDLGAGTGALTSPLVRTGATVLAFELHPQRVDELRARFAGSAVKVIRADVTNLRLPRRPFHVVSNPPFAASVAILRRLTSPGSRLVQAHVIVPRHTAERWSTAIRRARIDGGKSSRARSVTTSQVRLLSAPAQ